MSFYKHFRTAATKKFSDLVVFFKGNDTLSQNCYAEMILLRFPYSSSNHQKLKCVKYKLTALYFIAFHYVVFSIIPSVRKLLLSAALFCITNLYMWYGYITIYILPLHMNNKIKFLLTWSLCPFAVCRNEWGTLWCSDASLYVKAWHEKFQSCEANYPLSSKKLFKKETFLKKIFFILSALFFINLKCWHFLTLFCWLQ